jgi:hypothetical protein
MFPYDEDDYLEPVPFKPAHEMNDFDDLEGSGCGDFGMYDKYYDGDFDEIMRDNYRSLVNPLDELEDLASDGSSLEYKRIPAKRKKR